jgi:protein-L-isoaspartate(D-aspartate) O-methyltransferase
MSAAPPDRTRPLHQLLLPRQNELQALVRETIESRGIRDPRVLDALRRVPRHAFVPQAVKQSAYSDSPLPIGWGQTISQPYIVALMTEAAKPSISDRCLEIGTGSGYQTAVLSLLCREVYSIECVTELFRQCQLNLQCAGCLNAQIHLRQADGYHGWPEAAPFDLIVVTAAPQRIPDPLLMQLGVGGRLVIPVGPENAVQHLERWTRHSVGSSRQAFLIETLLDVRFVPMTGSVQQLSDCGLASTPSSDFSRQSR